MNDIATSIKQVKQTISKLEEKYLRPPGSVKLLAVSKRHNANDISIAYREHQNCFGENQLQEAVPKIMELKHLPLKWHFIGQIQSNKTQLIAQSFDWVQSLDRIKIARRLNEHCQDKILKICIQVNISNEPQKAGIAPNEVMKFAEAITHLDQLKLKGLMCIPTQTDNFDILCAQFRKMRQLYESLLNKGYPLNTLSMGMSDDLEAAIKEGATLVRVGKGIFGSRL